jgi:predicted phage tail protein
LSKTKKKIADEVPPLPCRSDSHRAPHALGTVPGQQTEDDQYERSEAREEAYTLQAMRCPVTLGAGGLGALPTKEGAESMTEKHFLTVALAAAGACEVGMGVWAFIHYGAWSMLFLGVYGFICANRGSWLHQRRRLRDENRTPHARAN